MWDAGPAALRQNQCPLLSCPDQLEIENPGWRASGGRAVGGGGGAAKCSLASWWGRARKSSGPQSPALPGLSAGGGGRSGSGPRRPASWRMYRNSVLGTDRAARAGLSEGSGLSCHSPPVLQQPSETTEIAHIPHLARSKIWIS